MAQVVPVLATVVGSGEGARLLARYNVSKDAAYSAGARKKGERVQIQVSILPLGLLLVHFLDIFLHFLPASSAQELTSS